MKVAYVRVSTLDQNLESKLRYLKNLVQRKYLLKNYQGETFKKEPYFKNH